MLGRGGWYVVGIGFLGIVAFVVGGGCWICVVGRVVCVVVFLFCRDIVLDIGIFFLIWFIGLVILIGLWFR